MKLPCFQKILEWLRFFGKIKKKRNGAFTLLSVFLFVIFTTLGLGMLYLTQVYLKISAYRKNAMLLEYASENGIKQAYGHLHYLLSSASSPIVLTEEETYQLMADSQVQGNAAVQRVLRNCLPLSLSDSWERLAWESIADFQFMGLREEQDYFHIEYLGRILSTGKLQGFEPTKYSALDSKLEMLAGHIPLPSIPLLLDKAMTEEQRKVFLEKNHIDVIPGDQLALPAPMAFSEGDLLPQQAAQQLAKALKIEIFHPQDLSASKLRLALGLEAIDEPVPQGTYLIQDDLGLGGIFVQGDLDEMILAIQRNYQIISFRQGQDLWVLKFSPEDGKTIFVCPNGALFFDFVPLGIIIVNGKILSLGGGYEDATGTILMTDEEEIPCVKRGVSLTIISSDEITLSSHLIYQGVTWQEGVPYVKDSDAQLVIHATGQDFLGDEEMTGQIVIGENSPEKMKVHASVTASGKGVTVLGDDKEVQILGSLQASELAFEGNQISIKFDDRFHRNSDNFFENVPLTERPVLHIFCFKICEWRENL
jgi:hypothetical protein